MDSIFNKNFWFATIFAVAIIWGWNYFFPTPKHNMESSKSEVTHNQSKNLNSSKSKIDLVSKNKNFQSNIFNVSIDNSDVYGSLSLQNGRINNIFLKNYTVDLDKNSPKVQLFSPKGSDNAYFSETGWMGSNTGDISAVWKANSNNKLTPSTPVVLTKEYNGLVFTKTISIDDKYMITVVDKVLNQRQSSVDVSPYALILRHGDPVVQHMFISHEGFVGRFNSTLEREKYDSALEKDFNYTTEGGYLGFTDKYFLSALILSPELKSNIRFLTFKDDNKVNNYQIDSRGQSINLETGKSAENTTRIFVGPKEYNIISGYEKQYSITNFDDTIDFGWFFFFTKPMIVFLLWIYHLVGNFGIAMLIFTVVIRSVILPIAFKSYISMAKMKELSPRVKELRERCGKDMQKYNAEVMKLYKEEKVSPLSGCLPLVLQIPIFFSIYKVIFISIELRHAPFFGWVHDLSAKDPTNLFNLFGLLDFHLPFSLGLWPILMGITMFLQQRLSSSQAMDPTQQKIMNFMPLIFTFILGSFPVGLVIYWTWSNTLSILQQLLINKKVHKEFVSRKNKPKKFKIEKSK